MSTQAKPIAPSTEPVKHTPEIKFPSVPEKQGEQGGEAREGSALLPEKKVRPEPNQFIGPLIEGLIVHYFTPNSWRPHARGQVRAALVAFCYRDSSGAPTGTVNLTIFLNGPVDTGDMGGPKTRCFEFEPGVKWSAELEGGCWSWAESR